MFGYASAIGIAKHNNRQILFERNLLPLKKLFPRLDMKINTWKTTHKWEKLIEINPIDKDERLWKLPKQNVSIGTYLQSFRYFEHINSSILRIFSYISPHVTAKANAFKMHVQKQASAKLQSKEITTVCVHVRRGDYLSKSSQYAGRRVPSSGDIKFAMNYIQSKFQHVIFIIASNGKTWCAKNLVGNNVFISNLSSYIDDFALMQSCNHMIMTVGTFGWWAAWITSQRGGNVMYYRDPYTVGSKKYNLFKRHNHFPGHWLTYTNKSVVRSRNLKK